MIRIHSVSFFYIPLELSFPGDCHVAMLLLAMTVWTRLVPTIRTQCTSCVCELQMHKKRKEKQI